MRRAKEKTAKERVGQNPPKPKPSTPKAKATPAPTEELDFNAAFARDGWCKFGNNCRHAHHKQEAIDESRRAAKRRAAHAAKRAAAAQAEGGEAAVPAIVVAHAVPADAE